nr:retrovirus-related Pol polyprotein from transposon TNT 1-94 [Tanacetum cinerariifolium]
MDKEVNIAARDSDNTLLERFKLWSDKVRLADDKTLDIAVIVDVFHKTYFGTSWTLKGVRLRRPAVKVTKGSLVVARGNKRESLYMVEDWYEHVSFQKKCSICTKEEEWRGKYTSLAHLKATAQMKCDIDFGIRRVTRLSEAEILHLWTRFMKPDTSEGFKNSGSFEDSRKSDEEYFKDGASSKEEGSGTPQAINKEMVSLEKNHTCSLVRILAGKKASQRLWMFKVKEEQNGRKRYKARLVVKGFQQNWGVDFNEIFSPVVKMTTISFMQNDKVQVTCHEPMLLLKEDGSSCIRQLLKVDDMLVACFDMTEFNKPKW